MRFLILLALIGAAVAVPSNPQRIVGGSPTTVDQYPYMSNMQYGLLGIIWYQACGGSLITTRTVLSAAHCFDGDSASQWRVILGTSLPASGGTTYNVQSIIMHPAWDAAAINNDVALIVLSANAALSTNVGVVSIAGPNYNLADGTVLTHIGWGTLFSGGPTPNQLQHVDINQISQTLCAERYAFLKTQPGYENWPDITPGMICAGLLDQGGADACQGDSGGPLSHIAPGLDTHVLVGIVSWGFGCADAFYPGVSARVSAYSDWIVANAI